MEETHSFPVSSGLLALTFLLFGSLILESQKWLGSHGFLMRRIRQLLIDSGLFQSFRTFDQRTSMAWAALNNLSYHSNCQVLKGERFAMCNLQMLVLVRNHFCWNPFPHSHSSIFPLWFTISKQKHAKHKGFWKLKIPLASFSSRKSWSIKSLFGSRGPSVSFPVSLVTTVLAQKLLVDDLGCRGSWSTQEPSSIDRKVARLLVWAGHVHWKF